MPCHNTAANSLLFIVCVAAVLFFLPTFLFAQSACVPPPPGVLAWWPFDETAGPTATELIAGRVGTYFGSPMPAPGEVGNALRFNGSTDFVGVANDNVWALGANDFSIELWANFSTPGGGSIGEPSHIFIGHDEGPGNRNKWFFALGGGFLNFHINSPTLGPHFFPLAPFSPALNTWYHLAVTRSGSLYRLYINGVPVASATNSATIPQADAFLTIGEAESLGFMNGLLDEVAIYNRALTGDEIAAIFAAGSAGKCKASNGAALQIQSVSPAVGGNAGQVTVSITGSGFQPRAVVNLVTGDPAVLVTGSNTGITPTGILQTTFDLTSVAAQNSLQVQVVNPDGTSATFPFAVVDGGAPQLQIEIVGPATVRINRVAQFVGLLRNVGLVDAPFVTVTATANFPSGSTPLPTTFAPSTPPGPTEPKPPVQVPLGGIGQYTLIAPVPTNVPIPIMIPFTFISGSSNACGDVQDSGDDFPPVEELPKLSCPELRDLLARVLQAITDLTNYRNGVQDRFDTLGCKFPTPATIVECFQLALKLAEIDLELLSPLLEYLIEVQNAIEAKGCPPPSPSAGVATQSGPSAPDTSAMQGVCPISSWDPNAKVGPAGIGPTGSVSGDLLPYTVFFENLASATAPAQQILIVDPLDQAIDEKTVSLGTLSLSGNAIDLGGGHHTTKTVDLRPGANALLQVQADVDLIKRQITWVLNALDPTTSQPPSDPQVGILPPNKTPPQGEGYVTFTASVKPGTPGNTTISNQATITFDVNPPIKTNVWSNTLASSLTATTIAYTGATTGDYHDAATLSATLIVSGTSTAVAGQTITFTLGGQSCTGVTNATGAASCALPLVLNQVAGSYTVTASFAGSNVYQASSASTTFTITKEETTLTYSGDAVIANNTTAHLKAVLLEDGIVPIQGRGVAFTLGASGGAQTCNPAPITDATGTALCTILVNQPLGPNVITASFPGDASYLPSSASANAIIFAFLARGAFVLGDQTASVGPSTDTFWADNWSSLNLLSAGTATDSFKGFASNISTNPPVCGDIWTSQPGNSSNPPDSPLPAYLGVVAASNVSQSGSTISGDVQKIVVVRTDPGYQPNPGHPGTGTVIAVYCK